MERSVEVFAVLLLGVLGLSHLVQPVAWAEYFILLRRKGRPGAFVDGFLHLPLAALIIGFHDVWSGLPAVLTLLGWAFLVKSLIRFCLPERTLTLWGRVSVERAGEFRVAGAGLLVLAALIGYGAYAR